VTKSELIEKISETLKLPAGKAEAIVNTIFDSMVKALERGEGIEIRGFGSFTVRKYKAYEGRNPRTGETVHVAEKRLPFFKVGKDLRERVNAGLGTPLPADKPDEPDDTDPNEPDYDDDDDELVVTVPPSPSTVTSIPSASVLHASRHPTTHGIPSSRASAAP
jgi:integration host factor subunit beta